MTDKERARAKYLAEQSKSLFQFYSAAHKRAEFFSESVGQAFYNHLLEVRPDLAAQIHATDKDPFLAKWQGEQWKRFIAFLSKNWYLKDSN